MSDYHIFLKYNLRNLKEGGPITSWETEQVDGFGTQEIDMLYSKALEIAKRYNLNFAGIRYRSDGLLKRCNMRDRVDGFEFHSNSMDDILAFRQEVLETKVGYQPLADSIEIKDYKGLGEDYVQF